MNILKKLLVQFFSFEDMENIRSMIAGALFHSGAGWLIARLVGKKGAVILVYHSVDGEGVFWDNVIKTKVFETQLNYLAKHRTVVSLSDILVKKRAGQPIPEDWVAITFDDGYKDYILNAEPLLRRHNFPATIFLCSSTFLPQAELFFDKLNRVIITTQKDSIRVSFSGHNQYYNLQSQKHRRDVILKLALVLRELPANLRVGFLEHLSALCEVPMKGEKEDYYLTTEDLLRLDSLTCIGSHSVSHPNLASLDEGELRDELQVSKSTLQNLVGDKQLINLFAYPFGKPWSFNGRVKKGLVECGYQCAVTTYPRSLSISDDMYELPRIGAGNSITKFKLNLLGVKI